MNRFKIWLVEMFSTSKFSILHNALILSVVFLSGCAAMQGVVDKGAKLNDNAVQISIFTLCEGGSFGSIRREFNTKEKAESLTSLCEEDKDSGLIPIILDND